MESLRITQRSFPFGRLTLPAEGNRELVVEHSTLLRSTRQAFPLHLVDPSPILHRNIPIGWVVFTAIPFLWLVAAGTDGWVTKGPGELFGVLFLAGIFLACLYNTIRLSSNTLHVRNANTAAVLVSMYRAKPTSSSVDTFVDALRRRIETFRTPTGASAEEVVELYRRHLDYLLENAVLLQTEYEVIIQRLREKVRKKNVVEIVR